MSGAAAAAAARGLPLPLEQQQGEAMGGGLVRPANLSALVTRRDRGEEARGVGGKSDGEGQRDGNVAASVAGGGGGAGTRKRSMIVVSEFIGCSPSLSGAIRVNPWNVQVRGQGAR